MREPGGIFSRVTHRVRRRLHRRYSTAWTDTLGEGHTEEPDATEEIGDIVPTRDVCKLENGVKENLGGVAMGLPERHGAHTVDVPAHRHPRMRRRIKCRTREGSDLEGGSAIF